MTESSTGVSLYQPRGYQQALIDGAFSFWAKGGRFLLIVLPTGGGKTFIFARIVSMLKGSVCVVAHRGELVAQISIALAREGVRHRIIGSNELARRCVAAHLSELQMNLVQPASRVMVCSIDTLIKMSPDDPLLGQVTTWVQDEAHHVLQENKWGKVARMFPRANGLGVTATPIRADGKGLGAHADGLFEEMLVGPSMRELIEAGYLTDYRIFAPPSDLDLSQVSLATDGDFNRTKLAKARRQSHITGDVIEHYLRIAPGKQGVTFDVDVETATTTAQAFQAAGVQAAIVHGGTQDGLRAELLARFRRREIQQLVNVDLFGEGFDVPAIEVVSMARPTQSYALFAQQFGRALRPLEGKTKAIIIDHVGNTVRHGLPDAERSWSLDRRERRISSGPTDVMPIRVCPQCTGAYERVYASCPFCGYRPEPIGRSNPAQVDGYLHELDPETLKAMRGEISRIDGAPRFPTGLDWTAQKRIADVHRERQVQQAELRGAMALWSGWQTYMNRPLDEQDRRFYLRYGVDKATAQTLGTADARTLLGHINRDLDSNGVVRKI